MTSTAAEPATSPAAPPPALAQRLPFIDGLRGLAVLMVLVYHCWVHTIRAPLPVAIGGHHLDLTGPLHYGYVGVHLFLLLSGFCLTYPLARAGAAGMHLDLRRFARRRVRRILPPYYVALAIFSLLPAVELGIRSVLGLPLGDVAEATAGQVVSHVFMVHNFSLAWMGAINASFWTLALEWQLYMVFPLLVWGFRRWGPLRILAAVLAFTLAYRSWVYTTQDVSRLEVGYIFAYALPGRLFEFVLGMAAAVALARMGEPPPAAWVRRYLAGSLLLGFTGLAVAHGWSPFAPITDVIWGLAFFCLVMYAGGRSAAGARGGRPITHAVGRRAVAAGPWDEVGGWLEWRPLVGLGFISYSVYLIHEPLIRRGYAAIQSAPLSPAAMLLLFELVVAPLLIGLGWLFFRAVEARFVERRQPVVKVKR